MGFLHLTPLVQNCGKFDFKWFENEFGLSTVKCEGNLRLFGCKVGQKFDFHCKI
jgi:hypothetical protein